MWSDGPLRFDDFRKGEAWETDNSFLYVKWQESKVKEKMCGVHYSYKDYNASMIPEFSYFKEGFATAEELRLNQGIFNINQRFARMYRDSLIAGSPDKKSAMSYFMKECDDEVALWRKTFSSNPDAPLPDPVNQLSIVYFPEYNMRRYAFLGFGYGANLFSLKSVDGFYYAGSTPVEAGVGFGPHFLSFGVDFDTFFDRKSAAQNKGQYGKYSAMRLKYGYWFLRRDRFRLGAFVGGGIAKYVTCEWNIAAAMLRKKEYEYPQIVEGVTAEYDLAKYVSLTGSRPDFSRISLFAQISAAELVSKKDGKNILTFVGGASAAAGLRLSFGY